MNASTVVNFPASLDPGFQPAVRFNRAYVAAAKKSGRAVPLVFGLERENGLLSRYETVVLPDAGAATLLYAERLVKFLLWARGGWKLHIGGPKQIGDFIRKHYSPGGARKFDRDMMTVAYGKKFQVVITAAEKVPAAKELQTAAGGHLKGCRIGFDLGASDYKFSAVIDGKAVFTDEVQWDPKSQTDPDYHYHHIVSALHRAAAHLPRVDAIGGSSAGVYVNNLVKVASLFRGVPDELFKQRGREIFLEIKRAWGGIPLEVVNDGEVTALAGAMTLNENAVLGIALGSSEAAGYVTPDGNITSWLNELAFAPVDYNPNAPADEWSGDRGCGAQYFSQQCVDRLLPVAGIALDPKMPVPEKLVEVQTLMAKGDERAARIYHTIGAYLGYAIAHYCDFYEVRHLLILGRVTSGAGGAIILDDAKQVLRQEFPNLRVQIHTPDEKEKRHGQAMAAASLPRLFQNP